MLSATATAHLQGSGEVRYWEAVSVPVPPHSTVYDFRQRIAQTLLHGQMVGSRLDLKHSTQPGRCILSASKQQA